MEDMVIMKTSIPISQQHLQMASAVMTTVGRSPPYLNNSIEQEVEVGHTTHDDITATALPFSTSSSSSWAPASSIAATESSSSSAGIGGSIEGIAAEDIQRWDLFSVLRQRNIRAGARHHHRTMAGITSNSIINHNHDDDEEEIDIDLDASILAIILELRAKDNDVAAAALGSGIGTVS
jgi:hypothetical protein